MSKKLSFLEVQDWGLVKVAVYLGFMAPIRVDLGASMRPAAAGQAT